MSETNKNLYQKFYLPALAAVFLAGLVLYLPILKNGFLTWDDPLYITENLFIRSFSTLFTGAFTEIVGGNWHPLTMLSHGLDYALFGVEPAGHHFMSVFLHALNSALVFVLCVSLVKSADGSNETSGFKALAAGLITAVIFAVHPLHVESVAWLSERKDLLSAFFFLLTLIAYIKYARSEGGRAKLYVLVLVLFLFSLMSKPMAVTLPAVLIIVDIFPLKRISVRTLIEKIPFFLLSLVFSVIAVFTQRAGGALSSVENVALASRIGVAARGYIFYIYKSILPVNLAPLYPYPKEVNLLSPIFGGAIVLIIVISVVSVLVYKRRKEVAVLWAAYVVTLLPVIGLVQIGGQGAADRYAYLPTIALFFLFALGAAYVIDNYIKRARLEITILVSVVLLALFSVPTLSQSRVWFDTTALWTHEIELYPEASPVPYNNRGSAYMDRGETALAFADFNKAIEVDSKFAKAFVSRGLFFLKVGATARSMADLERAIELNGNDAVAFNSRGLLFKSLGRFAKAKGDFTRGIEIDPAMPGLYNNRGLIYLLTRDYEKASKDFSLSLKLDPDNIDALNGRGALFNETGRTKEAIADFTRILEISPLDANAYNNRGSVKLNAGDMRGAIPDLERAAELDPSMPDAYLNLGHVYKALGDGAKSRGFYKQYEELKSKEKR